MNENNESLKEYDTKEFSYEMLEYLRKNTIIGPIAIFKIASAQREAALVQKYYQEVEHDNVELDTSIADSLEFSYRLNAFETRIFPMWEKYGDGLGLEEFAYRVINDHINQYKNNSMTR